MAVQFFDFNAVFPQKNYVFYTGWHFSYIIDLIFNKIFAPSFGSAQILF